MTAGVARDWPVVCFLISVRSRSLLQRLLAREANGRESRPHFLGQRRRAVM